MLSNIILVLVVWAIAGQQVNLMWGVIAFLALIYDALHFLTKPLKIQLPVMGVVSMDEKIRDQAKESGYL